MRRPLLVAAAAAAAASTLLAACGTASAPGRPPSSTPAPSATRAYPTPAPPPAVVRVATTYTAAPLPSRAVTATLKAGAGRRGKVFSDMGTAVFALAGAQGGVHATATLAEPAVRLEGTVSRGSQFPGPDVGDWWFHGTVTRDGTTSEVLYYADLDRYSAGLLWVRDGGADGRPWLLLDPTGLDRDAADLGEQLRKFAADHPGLVAAGLVTALLPWSAAQKWSYLSGGVASGPFRDTHLGRPALRFDLAGATGTDERCSLWLDADLLPVEQRGCLPVAGMVVVWDRYGEPGTGFVPPPAEQVTDVADLLR